MITLDQIKKLDQKVQAAVSRISSLKQENSALLLKLDEYQKRIGELEVLISDFKRDQAEIESGILNALEQLDRLEDSVDSSDTIDDAEPDSDQPDSDSESATDNTAASEEPDETPTSTPDESPAEETLSEEPEEPADQDESELDIF